MFYININKQTKQNKTNKKQQQQQPGDHPYLVVFDFSSVRRV